MAKTIDGLGEFGATQQTLAIARVLKRSAAERDALLNAIQKLGEPISYSNQDFDRQQHVAHLLANIARNGTANAA